jgi:hypothetical protein
MWKPLALIGYALVSTQALAVDPVTLENVLFNGSGCPRGQASVRIQDANRDGIRDQFEMISRTYIARQGGNLPLSERRKNCTITVLAKVQRGFQYSLRKSRILGFVRLPLGVRGQERSTYRFPLVARAGVSQSVFSGPVAQRYERQDNPGAAGTLWSPCGQNTPLSISTQVFLSGNQALAGTMSLERQIYDVQWRPCRG